MFHTAAKPRPLLPHIRTGFPALDSVIGGVPCGKTTELLGRPTSRTTPFVLMRYSSGRGKIYATSPQAALAGIQPDMSLSRAQALYPSAAEAVSMEYCDDGLIGRRGMVVVHQSPPTAKGFHFVTLEDEDGFINVIVSPPVYGQYRQIIRRNPLLVVEGIVQHEGDVTNVVAGRVIAMV